MLSGVRSHLLRRKARLVPAALVICVIVSGPAAADPGGTPPTDGTPHVRVRNIGLHIGGGPNDAVTKAPFLRQLAAEFDAFGRCYATTEAAGQRGTFGIDLLVPKEGGHPETSNPRTNLKGSAFRDCVVGVFGGVEFERPRRGATKLSYALSFDPA